jgi:hypothetical protein
LSQTGKTSRVKNNFVVRAVFRGCSQPISAARKAQGVAHYLMVQRSNFPNPDASDVRREFQ